MSFPTPKIKGKCEIGPKCSLPIYYECYNKYFAELEPEDLSSISFDDQSENGKYIRVCEACSIILHESQSDNYISEYNIDLDDFQSNQVPMNDH